MCGLPEFTKSSNLTGTLSHKFDNSTGRVQYNDLVLSGYGPMFMECHIVSCKYAFCYVNVMWIIYI